MFCNIIKMQTSYVLAVLFFSTTCTQCYPIAVAESEVKSTTPVKDEYTLPNGTVVGKYTYTDHEGNPVHVNYFADNSGYGVELKSVKIIEKSEPMRDGNLPKLDIGTNDILPPMPAEEGSTPGTFSFNFPGGEKPTSANDFMKNLPQVHWSAERGFNIGVPRNFPKLKKCTSSKVFYNDLNRKGRDIHPYKDGMPKVCEQF